MKPAATDRTPGLPQLVKAEDLQRCVAPFLEWGVDGVMLFDNDGLPFGGATMEHSPLGAWDQLPAEAQTAARSSDKQSFGLGSNQFEVRPAYAGADRVGVIVFSAPGDKRAELQRVANALDTVLGQLLQAGFATWVTSELHLQLSESSYVALQNKNAELQRAVDHLRDLDKLKSNFLATVSHELRTPLTSVIGFSEMLLEGLAGKLSGEQTEYVSTIRDRGDELLTLITQILEMSRLEVGAIRLDLRTWSLHDLVDKAISAVDLVAKKAGVTLVNEIEIDAIPSVLVDADKIHQVLVNLLSNAIKFTRDGGTVTVRARSAPIRRPFEEETLFGEEADDAVLVTVSDTGIGIAREQLERIFEPFYQVDSSPTREHGGAGLGLSIVKNLITAHGGEVWTESSMSVGTTFYFTLPIEPEAPMHDDDAGTWADDAV